VAVCESQLNQFAPDSSPSPCASVLQLSLKKAVGGIKAGAAPPLMISEVEHLGSEARYLTPCVPLQGHKPQGHIPAAHVCQGKTPIT